MPHSPVHNVVIRLFAPLLPTACFPTAPGTVDICQADLGLRILESLNVGVSIYLIAERAPRSGGKSSGREVDRGRVGLANSAGKRCVPST